MLRDLLSLAGAQLLSRLLGFVAFVHLARVLAPAGYGAVEIAASLAAAFAVLIEGGVGTIGVRRLVRDPGRTTRIAAEVLGTQLALALIAAVVMAGAGVVLVDDPQVRQLIVLYALGLLAVPFAQTWLFQGAERGLARSSLARAARMALFAVGVMVAVRSAEQLVRVGLVEVVALVGSGLLALALQARLIAPVRVVFRRVVFGDLVREGLPVSASNVLWGIELYAPPLLVAAIAGFDAAGFFGAAHRLVVSLATFSFVYHFNLYPVVSRLAAAAPERLEPLVCASFRVASWAGFALAVALTLAAEPLLAATFGAPFARAAPAFAVLVWVVPVTLLADHGRWILIAHGEERAIPRALLPGVLLSLGLGAPLVHRLGPLGGALAMLASALWVWGALHRGARRRVGWMPLAPAGPPLLLALVALALAPYVPLPALAKGALAGAAMALLGPIVDTQLVGAIRHLARARGASSPQAGDQQR